MPIDIVEFTTRFEDLLDQTEASFVELIGTLEIAKQRLLADALSDEPDDEYEDDEDDFAEDEDEDDDLYAEDPYDQDDDDR